MADTTMKSKPLGKQLPVPPDGWLEIGTIVGAHGLRGEVRVYPTSDFPERFVEAGQRWLQRPGSDNPTSIQLEGGWLQPGKGNFVVKLEGVNDRDAAEALRDCLLLVPEGDRPTLEEGEFHVADLIGLRVIDQATQSQVGVVTNVLPAGNDLLQVKLDTPRGKTTDVLVPFVEAIVPVVAIDRGVVEITPPPGLID